jgi:hypothetical protein
MHYRMREVALLCRIAALSGMLAWALDRPFLAAFFVAEVSLMATYLANPGLLN